MKSAFALLLLALISLAPAQSNEEDRIGTPWTGELGLTETTAQIMERSASMTKARLATPRVRRISPKPSSLLSLSAPEADSVSPSQILGLASAPLTGVTPKAPQTLSSINFLAATINDTGFSYPPDSMGVAGPTQFLVVINGRIRVFTKATGVVGPLDADLDVFFNTVRGADLTGDPRVRYDRDSQRWLVSSFTDATSNNKLLIAVSNSSTITSASAWTFFSFQQNLAAPAGNDGLFADYPTLGVDPNAVYLGAAMYSADTFVDTSIWVVRKSSLLSGGPLVVTAFRNLIGTGTNGPALPQIATSEDLTSSTGYLISSDISAGNKLIFRRISNPGGTPTLSANAIITIINTLPPINVPHKGNNLGAAGELDPVDDRLMNAVVRGGHLWTTHAIGANFNGASSGTINRNAVRWYDLLIPASGTPTVNQYGVLFSNASTNARSYFMPSIAISGQGHMALGCSTAGTNEYINAATAGRLATDPLGTLQAAVLYTASTTAYNPPGDSDVGGSYRRFGDYSMTCTDPSDDMSMWTIQEFCNATDQYGLQVVKLLAPPPALPVSCSPSSVAAPSTSVVVTLTGTSTSGSAFFEPGTTFTNHLTASVSGTGVTVASVSAVTTTALQLILNVTAGAAAGGRTITITNPDGQALTSTGNLLTITAGTLDTDSDGIPDAYELANGMNPNLASDAALDPDQDGFTNLQEYLAGTDPRSFASALRLSASKSGTIVTLSLTTVSGKNYLIQRSTSLSGWTTLQTNIPGTGGIVNLTDTATSGQSKLFYRAVHLP